jgi:PAS domain S-box-containing protein
MSYLKPSAAAPSYSDVLDALPIVAFMADADGNITYVSAGWTEFTGYSADEALGVSYARGIDPDDAERVVATWIAACAREQPYSDEFRVRRRDGSTRWVLSQAAPMRDPATGAITAWFGTVIDIDDRKRTAESLRASEALYRGLSGALPGVTWAASPAGDLTYVGDRWIDLHGEPPDGALGERWIAAVHPGDRDRVAAVWSHSLATGDPYKIEFRVRVADGTYHWFLVQALPVRADDGSIERWVGVNIDIEDRHAADEAREMYVALAENSTDFVAVSEPDGRVVYVNSAGRKLLGIESLEQVQQTRGADYFLAEDLEMVRSVIFPALEAVGHWSGDFRFRHFRSGEAVPVAYNVFLLTRADGSRIGFATVSRDLRERKRVEDGLRLLARTGAAVVDSLDYQRTLRNIARAFVDGFASYCLIDIMRASGKWERTAEHRDSSFIPLLMGLSRPPPNHPATRAIEHGESSFMPIDDNWARGLAGASDDRLEAVRRLRVRSIVTVPVVLPSGDVVGALTCALDDVSARENYGPDDLGFVEEVGRRAGAAIANVQLYERERRIALELQSASLPARLPTVEGVRLDAAYRPGSNEAKIGGDWYDAFLLPDKRLVITVGDVLGHGLQAAVSMTKLRLAMQSAAMVNPEPNLMLRVADATLRLSDPDAYATAIAAVYDPAVRSLTFASAGHPGPALRTALGNISDLTDSGRMIGLREGDETDTRTVAIPAGSTLVFYTDGLVEVTRDMDEGFRRLSETLARGEVLSAERPADEIVRAVLGSDLPHDDIAVLVITFEGD